MKQSLLEKLQTMVERHEEISLMLSSPDVIGNQESFRALSREYAQLEPLVKAHQVYQSLIKESSENDLLMKDSDPDIRAMASDEFLRLKTEVEEKEEALQILLLPQDEADARNVYLEIRAGTGGDEAAIFAGDLFRMYLRYAESKRWKVEIISEHEGDHGGYKEVVALVSGNEVYRHLKFESGAHRVQRVPETESQGRVHTSACTVAILPEVDAIDDIAINTEDLRIDTYRASGAGGQHVNKTDSAIRITHLPTGVVVECQDERSQHKNRAKAMALLQTRLLDSERQKQAQEQASTRKSLVGSGDRSERIRTYNYPQGRITDHRVNLTLYQLEDIVEGNLDPIILPLLREYQAEQLAMLTEDHGGNNNS